MAERPAAADPAPLAGEAAPLIAPWLDDSFSETRRLRHDGWTPERRRVFVERLAETAVVADAAHEAGMSAQSAYGLRNRDRLFAAAWEAAITLGRRRLADELMARAMNGCVEQIVRDGCIVGERHRYDNRLSMAVLTRLDARLDRDGAAHVRLAERWDELLGALAAPDASGDELLDTARNAQLHQLHPAGDDVDEVEDDGPSPRDWHEIWWEGDDGFTDYPPPPDFDGVEHGAYGDDDYKRELTVPEIDAIEAGLDERDAAARANGARQRERAFAQRLWNFRDPCGEEDATTGEADGST